MIKFALGVVVGIIIATVGISGVTRMMDNGVTKVQDQARELAK